MAELLQLKLEDASLDEIEELALKAIGSNASAKKNIDVKDVSGNSGAKTYVCSLPLRFLNPDITICFQSGNNCKWLTVFFNFFRL